LRNNVKLNVKKKKMFSVAISVASLRNSAGQVMKAGEGTPGQVTKIAHLVSTPSGRQLVLSPQQGTNATTGKLFFTISILFRIVSFHCWFPI
jgi:hypothetical protein